MDATHPAGTNGRPRAKPKATAPTKAKARARKDARPAVPHADRGVMFEDWSPERFRRYQHFLDKLPACPGYRAVVRIIAAARDLRELVATTVEEYGPGSGSVIERYNAEFDLFAGSPPGLWDELMGMVCHLMAAGAAVDAKVPMAGPTE